MRAFKTTKIDIQLYQISPNSALLATNAVNTRDYLLDSKEFEDSKEARTLLLTAETLEDVFSALGKINDRNHQARTITSALNRFLSNSSIGHDLNWDDARRGIRISDESVLKQGHFRNILTALIVQLRFDRFVDGRPVFTIIVRNPLFFSKNIPVDIFSQFLHERRKVYLPAYDQKKNFNNILRSVDFKEVYMFEPKSRQNPKPSRIGERFVAAGRMSHDEYDELQKNKTKFPVCYSTPYSDYKRQYCYPARDIEIVASDSLLKLQNDNDQIEFPDELAEAIGLYRYAKSLIREQMDSRSDLIENLKCILGQFFDLAKPISAECNFLQTPRYKLRGRTKINQQVKAGEAFYTDQEVVLGINALAYPSSENTPEREEKFLSFFSSRSKAGQFGFKFEKVSYSAKMAVQEPVKTAERIVQESGGCNAALVAWPNWTHLPNNKMLEFELMRRGVAVQNVVNQNFKKDAPKISALIKGMVEKFPVTEVLKADASGGISPFHCALGLDVSRHGKLDIASFPVVIDQDGKVTCTLGDTPYTEDKEKRSVKEILSVIKRVIETRREGAGEQTNILFLRDGIAFEDYQEIADQLPSNVTLTVVSVRKNIMNACSEDMPEGDFYSVFSELDHSRFVFGVNARQGDEAKITRLHLAQVMLNPIGVDMANLGRVLIALSCQNKTTEVEIASLPFPIAYADRMAWTIRDMVQDAQLIKHVSSTYPKEVDEAGGATLFIYKELKRFVETRENGYSFAI